jgi:pimeloyl-ACP methyl ester carboxylesterase
VCLVVYLCPRFSAVGRRADEPRIFQPDFHPQRGDGASWWRADDAIRVMYRHLDADTARAAAATLGRQADTEGGTLDRLPDVPTEVVIAREDEIFTLEWSRWAARTLAGVEPIELAGGHFPMLERPQELAELLIGLRARHGG